MKNVIAVVLLAAALVVQAQQEPDKPPVITVRITAEEKAAIDASSKAVDDAQAALEEAKQKQSSLENKVIQDKRDKMNIPWAECAGFGGSFYISGSSGFASSNPDHAKGYIAELRGSWIVFTRGYSVCHGV